MRIRKRQVPLPLSSLSPIPLSGPLLFVPNNSSTKPSPPRIDPPEDLAPDRFPGGEKANNYHSRGSDSAAEKAPAGSSPSSEAVKKGMLSSHEDDDDYDDERDVKMKGSSSGKRRGRLGGGGTGGEGSRCSRVNGRGWRCGQQTLVGYSLCEHHLGKGRLRSVANVRGRSTISMTETPGNENEKPQQPHEPSPSPLPFSGTAFPGDIEEEDDEKEEDSTSTGPRKKARSMSSLLGQGSDQDASISLT